MIYKKDQTLQPIPQMWSEQAEVSTNWSPIPGVPSDYKGNLIVNLGVKMDDTIYKMDDAVATISDTKISSNAASPTNWT